MDGGKSIETHNRGLRVTTSAFTKNPTCEICSDSDTSNNDQGGVGAENVRLAYREVLGPRCSLEEWVDWNQHAE